MKTVMSGINKVYDGFNKINEWFIIFLMALMCLDLLAQVDVYKRQALRSGVL